MVNSQHHGCCRYGFIDNLTLGGPTPIGARAANLTEMTRPFMEEVALNEQVRLRKSVQCNAWYTWLRCHQSALVML